jgi:hypothetical protein
MDLGLAGKVYIVTGASRGLGRAVAETLVADGARVVLSARDGDQAKRAASELGRDAAGVAADNADPEAAERLIIAAHEHYGRLDGAVLSVGGPPAGSVVDTPDEDWRAAFESVFLGGVRLARTIGVALDDGGAWAIARRSRGTPRVANRLLKRVRDYAEVRSGGGIDAAVAGAALDLLEVDHEGLDRLDREILSIVCTRFGGGPVGLSTLAVAVQEEADTIEDVYEPYLLQRGFLQRTPRGRCATPHAFRHLGLRPPESAETLFG